MFTGGFKLRRLTAGRPRIAAMREIEQKVQLLISLITPAVLEAVQRHKITVMTAAASFAVHAMLTVITRVPYPQSIVIVDKVNIQAYLIL